MAIGRDVGTVLTHLTVDIGSKRRITLPVCFLEPPQRMDP